MAPYTSQLQRIYAIVADLPAAGYGWRTVPFAKVPIGNQKHAELKSSFVIFMPSAES